MDILTPLPPPPGLFLEHFTVQKYKIWAWCHSQVEVSTPGSRKVIPDFTISQFTGPAPLSWGLRAGKWVVSLVQTSHWPLFTSGNVLLSQATRNLAKILLFVGHGEDEHWRKAQNTPQAGESVKHPLAAAQVKPTWPSVPLQPLDG